MVSFLLYSENLNTVMNLREAGSDILTQLTELVSQIREEDFAKPSDTLSKSTIGQHIRHTLEFFMCFEAG